MFMRQYGDVNLAVEKDVPMRGKVLRLRKPDSETDIYMDFCGYSIADGTNAYMFGNRLFVVTCWAGMTEEERNTASVGEINLVLAPQRFLQAAMRVGEYDWSDISFSLYHCMRFLNDETQPVESIVFLFCDQLSGEIAAEREVVLPQMLQDFLRASFQHSYQNAALDAEYDAFLQAAAQSDSMDFCDILYNRLAELSQEDVRIFRDADVQQIPFGVYITVSAENEVTDLHQNTP